MPEQKQHVEFHRKIDLRKRLLAKALPGAVYVPYCGDGDIAAEVYPGRDLVGCDLDSDRIATIRDRLPTGAWFVADANDCLPDLLQDTGPKVFAVADIDAYAYPYDTFHDFWANATKARRVALFFTDGEMQTVRRRTPAGWRHPSGEHIPQAKTMADGRELYNFYWQNTIEPWFRDAIAPWRVLDLDFYKRNGNVLYWGAVVENVANVGPEESATPDTPLPSIDEATDEDLGYDPLRNYKFDGLKRRQFLRRVADGDTRTSAARAVGVTLRTIERACNEQRGRFGEMLSWCEMEADDEIEGSLYRAARSGNVAAIAMWLYNRRPERWADRRSHRVDLQMDDAALKVIGDILARTVTDPDTLGRIRAELARVASAGLTSGTA